VTTSTSPPTPPATGERSRTGTASPGRWATARRLLASVGLPAAAFVAAFVLPGLTTSQFRLSVLTVVFVNASLAAGLVVSLGYAGMLNLSHATFYGFGAYATAVLVAEHGLPLAAALPVAAGVGALGAVVLGLTSLRVGGDYFALVSLAFSIAMVQVMENWTSVTKGREGYFGIPETSIFGMPIDSNRTGYYACLGLLAVTWVIVARFTRTYAARSMLAVRYDEVAAAVMGVNVKANKLAAMALSGALAGLAGSFLVATYLFVKPSSFDFAASFNILLWVIIGGMASLRGAVVVASGLTLFTEEFRSLHQYRTGLLGLVVLVAVFHRGGVLSDWYADARGRHRDRKEVRGAPLYGDP